MSNPFLNRSVFVLVFVFVTQQQQLSVVSNFVLMNFLAHAQTHSTVVLRKKTEPSAKVAAQKNR
jgi:hypothetical protein